MNREDTIEMHSRQHYIKPMKKLQMDKGEYVNAQGEKYGNVLINF